MKFSSFIIILLACGPALAQQPRPAPRPAPDPDVGPAVERAAAADAGVSVSLCLSTGDVVVRGWDRAEVRVRASEGGPLVLQTDGAAPTRRVEVLVGDAADSRPHAGACGMADGLELSVPRGASVSLRLSDGDISVSDVADLTVNNMSGDVDVRGISRRVEVSTMSGDVSLSDSRGRARLRAVSGTVTAVNVTPLAAGDGFEANSTSGDVDLDRVLHTRVTGSTISGSVRMSGPLAAGGTYEFKTISGDVTVALPSDASFRLNAKVVMSGEIVTDFPVRANYDAGRAAPPPPPDAPPTVQGRPRPAPRVQVGPPQPTLLVGTVGDGDAALDLSSFSGTVHLKRR